MDKIIKVKKKFFYKDIELQIVEREEEGVYNPQDKTIMTRVVAPNGGVVPYSFKHRETLKNIIAGVTALLENFESGGADVIAELTKNRPKAQTD